MTEDHAKYVLEHDLIFQRNPYYPKLDSGECPDLQNETKPVSVEATCCDTNKFDGWLRDIATGATFPDKEEKAKKRIFNYIYKMRRERLRAKLPSKECWDTYQDAVKAYFKTEVSSVMMAKASSFALSRDASFELSKKLIVQAVDKKMSKLSDYAKFDRMELFICLKSLILNDSKDVLILYEILQEHVFDENRVIMPSIS